VGAIVGYIAEAISTLVTRAQHIEVNFAWIVEEVLV
jgi:hypothetical protein